MNAKILREQMRRLRLRLRWCNIGGTSLSAALAAMQRIMKTGWVLTGVLTLTVLLPCGCGTVRTRTSGGGGPYHGFGYDMEKVSSGEEWLTWSGQGRAGGVPFLWPRGLLWVLDVPLSFTADTLMLPVDALRPKAAKAKAASEVGETDGAANGSQSSAPRQTQRR